MHIIRTVQFILFAALPTFVFAQSDSTIIGKPVPGGINLQPAATGLARDIVWLDKMVTIIMAGIVVFVVALLAIILVRYNHKANKKPASFSHHSALEITWTVIPILILIFIGWFSVPILFKQQKIPAADIVIKATGYQWFWGYEYPDHGIEFDSLLLSEDELEENGYSHDEYLLATDNPVVMPVNKIVVIQITGGDVIHSWAIPAFGVKQDGVPGRLSELWFKAEKQGIYFGQCSELCGKDHAYMPITVKVVSEQEFAKWLEEARTKFARKTPAAEPKVAANLKTAMYPDNSQTGAGRSHFLSED